MIFQSTQTKKNPIQCSSLSVDETLNILSDQPLLTSTQRIQNSTTVSSLLYENQLLLTEEERNILSDLEDLPE